MISVTYGGKEARLAIRLMAEYAARRAAPPMTLDELGARILEALPAKDVLEVYEKAGLQRPWFRAGHALRRLRKRGLVVLVHDATQGWLLKRAGR